MLAALGKPVFAIFNALSQVAIRMMPRAAGEVFIIGR